MKNIVTISILSFFCVLPLFAQEGLDKVKAEIDSSVNEMSDSYKGKFDSYFVQYDSTNDTATEYRLSIKNPYWNKHLSRYSLYSFSPDNGIQRNQSILFPWENDGDKFNIRYNRVEGLFLGFNYPQKYFWDSDKFKFFGSFGYGFQSHLWRYGWGVSHQFGFNEHLLEFGAENHSVTDSKDQWIVSEDENTVAALFTKNDYRDYFERKGFSLWTGLYHRDENSDMQARVAYLNDDYASMDEISRWSLFRRTKNFRNNPAISEGKIKSLVTSLEYHNSDEGRYFSRGWSVAVSGEYSGNIFKNDDFNFNRYILDVRRYQPLGNFLMLNLRMRAGTSTGVLPLQKTFDIGGISTLPGFYYKAGSGNRMLLGNMEYIMNAKIFDDDEIFPSWLLRNSNIIFFFDAGYVANATPFEKFSQGFERMTFGTFNSDYGVAVGSRDGKLRLGFAWRTDIASAPNVFIRLERPF